MGIYNFWQDVRGSVVALTDGNGTVQTQYAYDGFGNATVSGSTAFADEVRYTARFFDNLTGLQHNRARWYDPQTGRWISEDPMGLAAGDANLYRYAGNGQTNASDPSGMVDPTEPRWHHLFPRAIWEKSDFLERHGLAYVFSDCEWGWILSHQDHVEIHRQGWNRAWLDWIKEKEDAGIKITMKMIEGKLSSLKRDPRFASLLRNGRQATVAWRAWSPSRQSGTGPRRGFIDRGALVTLGATAIIVGGVTTVYDEIIDLGWKRGMDLATKIGLLARLGILAGEGDLPAYVFDIITPDGKRVHIVLEPEDLPGYRKLRVSAWYTRSTGIFFTADETVDIIKPSDDICIYEPTSGRKRK